MGLKGLKEMKDPRHPKDLEISGLQVQGDQFWRLKNIEFEKGLHHQHVFLSRGTNFRSSDYYTSNMIQNMKKAHIFSLNATHHNCT